MEKNFNDEILTDLSEIRRSLNRTERNVAFFAIITIIGLIISAFTVVIVFFN